MPIRNLNYNFLKHELKICVCNMASDSISPVCTLIVIAKVYLVFILVIIPHWFIVINGNIVKHATCSNKGANSVWGHSNLRMQEMKSSFQDAKSSFNRRSCAFLCSIKSPLLYSDGVVVWCHKIW